VSHYSFFIVWAGALALVACAPDQTATGPVVARRDRDPGSGIVTPMCQLGCVEQDPDPEAPGVFLGSGVTPDVCIWGGYTDSDQDGLGEFCENHLGNAFAPELYYWSADNTGREPYWVAGIAPDGESVVLGYLLSYYRDEGSNVWACGLPGAPSSCHGHNGDSEAILLTVYYNSSTQHWVLDHANYSQHGDYPSYARGANEYPQSLYYPSHAGTYPRAYVSQGKHANYASASECNSGGTFGSDTCESVNTAARIGVGSVWNLGSRSTPRIDCVTSRDPNYEYYGSGRQECYWTTQNFRGWIPTTVGGAEAGPYSPVLSAFGF